MPYQIVDMLIYTHTNTSVCIKLYVYLQKLLSNLCTVTPLVSTTPQKGLFFFLVLHMTFKPSVDYM